MIGQEVSEQLDYVPAKLTVIEHVRLKYACPACEAQVAETGPQIRTAEKPLAPIEKGLAAPGLLAYVIVSKYGDHRVPRARRTVTRPDVVRNCTRDEGRSLGTGLQEQVPNRLKLRGLRARVVNVEEKARKPCQVRIKETSASEPLLTCRNVFRRRQNRDEVIGPGSVPAGPAYGWGGVRHEGGVTLIRALVRNVGTCRPDAKGATQVETP